MRWLFLNMRERFLFACRNPGYVLKSLARELTLADERLLAKVTGRPAAEIRGFLDEPARTSELLGHFRRCEETFRQAGFASADLYAKKILLQYAAVRAMRPETVVETGVANGVSGSYLLLALDRNGRGNLHSIEVGDVSYLPPGQAPGWIVPERLRSRWKLHIGDSRALLPELLAQLGQVDIFIHDSLHTYDHMRFEFEQAYPFVKPGGLLMADDALWNTSFMDFAGAVRAPAAKVLRGVGFMRK